MKKPHIFACLWCKNIKKLVPCKEISRLFIQKDWGDFFMMTYFSPQKKASHQMGAFFRNRCPLAIRFLALVDTSVEKAES